MSHEPHAPKGTAWLVKYRLPGGATSSVLVVELQGLTAYEAWREASVPTAFSACEFTQLAPYPASVNTKEMLMSSRYDGLPIDDTPAHTGKDDCPACKRLEEEANVPTDDEVKDMVGVLMDQWDSMITDVGNRLIDKVRRGGKERIQAFLKRNNIPEVDTKPVTEDSEDTRS